MRYQIIMSQTDKTEFNSMKMGFVQKHIHYQECRIHMISKSISKCIEHILTAHYFIATCIPISTNKLKPFWYTLQCKTCDMSTCM